VTRIIFHREAKAELRAAARWYNQELPGLGRDFREESKAAVARIVAAPEAFGILYEDVRCHQLHRFPYGILYQIQPDRIFVVAVMHLHREPDYWKDRV
jgi:mRNA-degrading endonuclease RelE of RelBE toxin-antitoxin system